MMTRFQAFERRLTLASRSLVDPKYLPQALARFARDTRDELIARGDASPRYETSVNGIAGRSEDQVRLPGPIVYRFEYLEEVVSVGLRLLREGAPVLSGRYRDSFFAMVNGSPVSETADLPLGAEVILTNDQPYSRKIQVGAQQTSVPSHLFDRVQKALRRTFGDLVMVELRFIPLQGGYVLRRRGTRAHLSGTRKRRPDVRAGDDLTYPALVINVKH
jgi:hypothetical protein